MTALSCAPLRTLAFGDRSTGVWGFVWSARETLLMAGALEEAESAEIASPVMSDDGDGWILERDEEILRITPCGPASEPDGGWAQLCRVDGELAVGGQRRAVACTGVRAEGPAPELGELDALRLVAAWFGDEDGLALSAARPRGAPGQERDEVRAVVFEPRGPVAATDSRLSTTYAADGRPIRVGLELWLPGEKEGEEYPVRAAGEALGPPVAAQVAAVSIEAGALLAHRGGRDGLATYAVARVR
jgi:hypothetical protein